MSEAARRAVRLHSKATEGDLACLLELAGFCDERYSAFVCWPSQRTLANFLHVDERSVRRTIARLKEQGYITTMRRGRRNYYTLRLPEASDEEYRALLAPDRTGRSSIDDPDRTERSSIDDIGQGGPEYIGQGGPEYIGQVSPEHRTERSSHMKGSESKYEKENEREATPIYDNLARQRAEIPSPPPPSPAQAVWRRMHEHLRESMGRSEFETWIRGTNALWTEAGALRIQVRTSHAVDLLSSRYSERLQEAARKVTGGEIDIEIASKGATA